MENKNPSKSENQLICGPQHDYSPLNMVCLKPTCFSSCLICPRCAEYSHNGSQHRVQHLDQFKQQTLKLLSVNSGNVNNAFLETLKMAKNNLVEKVKQAQNIMCILIKKLKLAINNQFQTIIQSFNPQTYKKQLQSLNSKITAKKITDICYRIQVVKRNQFNGSIGNILTAEKQYTTVFQKFNNKFNDILNQFQKIRYVQELKMPPNYLKTKQIDPLFSGSELIKNVPQYSSKMEIQPPVDRTKRQQQEKTLNQMKIMQTQIISLDSSSSLSRSRDKKRIQSRDQRKLQAKEKIKKSSIKRDSNQPLRIQLPQPSNLSSKNQRISYLQKNQKSEKVYRNEKIQKIHQQKNQKDQKHNFSNNVKNRVRKTTRPFKPQLYGKSLKSSSSSSSSSSSTSSSSSSSMSSKSSSQSQNYSSRPSQSKKSIKKQNRQQRLQKKISTKNKSNQVDQKSIKNKRQNIIITPPFQITKVNRPDKGGYQTVLTQWKKKVEESKDAQKYTKRKENKLEKRSSEISSKSKSKPMEPNKRDRQIIQQKKKEQNKGNQQINKLTGSIKRPPRYPPKMTEEQLKEWFNETYGKEEIYSMILSHRRNSNVKQYLLYCMGSFKWADEKYIVDTDESERMIDYIKSLDRYDKK